MRNILKISGVFAGVILGAGFASGQEILKFFVRYGRMGCVGLAAAGILFGLTGYAVLELCRKHQMTSYSEFLGFLIGAKFSAVAETMVSVFLFVLFVTMTAGAGAIGRDFLHLSFSASAAVMAALCFVTLCFGLDAIVKTNTVLSPLLVAGGIFIGLYTYYTQTKPVFLQALPQTRNWLVSAMVYASYNLLPAVALLPTLSKMAENKRTAFWGGTLGGLSVAVLGCAIALPLFIISPGSEIPMLDVALTHGKIAGAVYTFFLLAAVYTAAVINAHTFLIWLRDKFGFPLLPARLAVCVAAFALSHAGFSRFVEQVYPLFGYIGLFEILVIWLVFLFGGKR